MWTNYEAESANGIWERAITDLWDVPGQQEGRSGATREILHVAISISNPRDRWVTSRRPALNVAFALAEVVWILSGRSDAKFLTFFNNSLKKYAGVTPSQYGAYGSRLRTAFGFDQLDRACSALTHNPNSRQIVLQIWDPHLDLPFGDGMPRSADIPCNTQSILKIRDGNLEWLQIMRSNDAFLGLPYNIIQFTFLQEIVAGWLGVEVGHYHHVSDSLHLYERDLDAVRLERVANPREFDDFRLPKSQSENVIQTLAQCIDQIIDPNLTVEHLLPVIAQAVLPRPYMDVLKVLVAEGLRRRSAPDSIVREVVNGCRNPTLRAMWLEWEQRMSSR